MNKHHDKYHHGKEFTEMAKKRITVTIDEELDKSIRSLQTNLISSTQRGCSYSKALEIAVKKGLETKTVKKTSSKPETSLENL